MVALIDTEKRVLDLIGALPPERRRLMLYELAKDSEAAWSQNTAFAESQLRKLAEIRGLQWDQMDDEQREGFVCELIREDD